MPRQSVEREGAQKVPGRPSRRTVLKAGFGFGLFLSGFTLSETTGLLPNPGDILTASDFLSNIPEYGDHPAVTVTTEYGDLSQKIDPNDPTMGQFVHGDSIGAGFSERDSVSTDYHLTKLFSPIHMLNNALNALNMPVLRNATKADAPNVIGWAELNNAVVGATTADTVKQLDEFVQESYKDYSSYRGPFDIVLSTGGNDLLNLLVQHLPGLISSRILPDSIALAKLVKSFNDFLPKFEENYTACLVNILSQKKKNTPFEGMGKLFIYGIPDGRKITHIDMRPTGQNAHFDLASNQRHVAGVISAHMNKAILRSLERAKAIIAEQHPEVILPDILFIDLKNVELDGIHPSTRGYQQIATQIASRCQATFEDGDNSGSRTFLEELTRKNISITIDGVDQS